MTAAQHAAATKHFTFMNFLAASEVPFFMPTSTMARSRQTIPLQKYVRNSNNFNVMLRKNLNSF